MPVGDMPYFFIRPISRFVRLLTKLCTSVYTSTMPTTVRISDHGRHLLGQLAEQSSSTMTEVLDAALDSYRRECFLKDANVAYAALAADPAELKAFRDEMRSLDGTLGDGLEKYPV